jgi:hypothetical protein
MPTHNPEAIRQRVVFAAQQSDRAHMPAFRFGLWRSILAPFQFESGGQLSCSS